MLLLYNLIIRLYVTGIRLSALWGNPKAVLWLQGRKGWRQRVASSLAANEKRVWFHCSSMGEFEQGRVFLEKFRAKYPEYKLVLTFFSPSGYEHRKDYKYADYIFYLPSDKSRNAIDFVGMINPEKAFFIKYDYWYNYLHELHQRHTPVYIISAIFRNEHRFFQWYGGLFRKMLGFVTHFFVQNDASKELLRNIGIRNVTVCGDTRFDRVIQKASEPHDIEQVSRFKNNKNLLVAGSTWHEDDVLLADVVKRMASDDSIKFIIVPHEIGHRHIGQLEYLLIEKAGLTPDDIALYSDNETNLPDAKVLLVDTVGLLSSVYRYGRIAYIGGGFGKGIHNILEAAAYGMPVFFGPNYAKFTEATELLKEGAAFAVHTSEEMLGGVQRLLSDKQELEKTGAIAKSYVQRKAGASDRILELL